MTIKDADDADGLVHHPMECKSFDACNHEFASRGVRPNLCLLPNSCSKFAHESFSDESFQDTISTNEGFGEPSGYCIKSFLEKAFFSRARAVGVS